MKEEGKEKPAFTLGDLVFYECNRVAFGLINVLATFQGLMEFNLDFLISLDDNLIF